MNATTLTVTALCGGIDNVAAKGGFRMSDGSTRFWVATRASHHFGTKEVTDADEGITITRTPCGPGVDKIVAHCHGAVAVIK